MGLRNVYTDPLKFLRAELLQRCRDNSRPLLDLAVLVTIAGTAAVMRNTDQRRTTGRLPIA